MVPLKTGCLSGLWGSLKVSKGRFDYSFCNFSRIPVYSQHTACPSENGNSCRQAGFSGYQAGLTTVCVQGTESCFHKLRYRFFNFQKQIIFMLKVFCWTACLVVTGGGQTIRLHAAYEALSDPTWIPVVPCLWLRRDGRYTRGRLLDIPWPPTQGKIGRGYNGGERGIIKKRL